jgi:hypothetical protein
MNWFERYGIVGMYFLLISLFWVVGLSSGLITELMGDEAVAKILIALLGFSLPIGYILTNISMSIYYNNCSCWFSRIFDLLSLRDQIHLKLIKEMTLSDQEKLKLLDVSSEHISEARLTSLIRLMRLRVLRDDCVKTDNLEHLGIFCTRRFDVLAINRSIMLATLLAPFLTWFTILIFRSKFKFLDLRIIFPVIVSVIVYWVLSFLNKILQEQIKEINNFSFF